MIFRFAYDPRECFRAIRLAQRLRRRVPVWLFAVPGVVALGWLVAGTEGVDPTASWILVRLLLVYTLVVYGLVPLAILHAAYRVPRRDPALAAQRTCTLTAEGLEVRTHGASADLAWSHFQRAVETRELFLLLPRLGGLHYLPKRALAGEADVRTARALLATHLGQQFEPFAGP